MRVMRDCFGLEGPLPPHVSARLLWCVMQERAPRDTTYVASSAELFSGQEQRAALRDWARLSDSRLSCLPAQTAAYRAAPHLQQIADALKFQSGLTLAGVQASLLKHAGSMEQLVAWYSSVVVPEVQARERELSRRESVAEARRRAQRYEWATGKPALSRWTQQHWQGPACVCGKTPSLACSKGCCRSCCARTSGPCSKHGILP